MTKKRRKKKRKYYQIYFFRNFRIAISYCKLTCSLYLFVRWTTIDSFFVTRIYLFCHRVLFCTRVVQLPLYISPQLLLILLLFFFLYTLKYIYYIASPWYSRDQLYNNPHTWIKTQFKKYKRKIAFVFFMIRRIFRLVHCRKNFFLISKKVFILFFLNFIA